MEVSGTVTLAGGIGAITTTIAPDYIPSTEYIVFQIGSVGFTVENIIFYAMTVLGAVAWAYAIRKNR